MYFYCNSIHSHRHDTLFGGKIWHHQDTNLSQIGLVLRVHDGNACKVFQNLQ